MENQCPICQDKMVEPRELPCNHVICSACITAIHHSSPCNLRCPFCRVPFKCPNGDCSSIPMSQTHTSFLLKEAETRASAEALAGNSHGRYHSIAEDNCSNHNLRCQKQMKNQPCASKGCGNPSKYYCLNGCGFMCLICQSNHSTAQETRGHDMLSSSSLGVSVYALQHMECSKHPRNSVVSFCEDCILEPLKCIICEAEDKKMNPNHRCKTLENAVTIMEKRLDDVEEIIIRQMDFASKERDEILSKTESLEDSAEALKESGKAKFKEYRAEIETYLQKLDEMEEDFIHKVDELHGLLLKELELSLNEIEMRENYLQHTRELIRETEQEWVSGTKNFEKLSYVSGLASALKSKGDFLSPSMKHTSIWDLEETDICVDIDIQKHINELKQSLKYPQYTDWINTKGKNRIITRKISSYGPEARRSYSNTGARVTGNVWGLAIDDEKNHVFVTDHQNACVHKFSLDLKEHLGQTKHRRLNYHDRKANGQIVMTSPYGIALSPNGHLVVVDNGAHVAFVMGRDFSYLGEITGFKSPCNPAFDKDGTLFITDLGNSRVRKYIFNAEDAKISPSFGYSHSRDFGLPHSECSGQQQEQWAPESIAVTRHRELCVMGRGSDTIHVFNVDGKWIRKLRFRRVGHTSLCRGPVDTLIVSDYASNRIDFLSLLDGSIVHSITTHPTARVFLQNPMGVAVGPNDLLYTCEFSASRISAF